MKHIRESIIGRRGSSQTPIDAKWYIEFGGLDPVLLKKYAKGEITYTDLTMGLVEKETAWSDHEQDLSEDNILDIAKSFVNQKYKFPDLVYARVMDEDKEVVDTIYGRKYHYDLDKYCKSHK